MIAKFCGNCGAELKDGAKFCSKCGTEQEEAFQHKSAEPSGKNTGLIIGLTALVVVLSASGFFGILLLGDKGDKSLNGDAKKQVESSLNTVQKKEESKAVSKDSEVKSEDKKEERELNASDLQGRWSGSKVYTEIRNLESVSGLSDEEKAQVRSSIGMALPFEISIAEGYVTVKITEPSGEQYEINNFYPIDFADGAFLTTDEFYDGQGNGIVVNGRMKEENGKLKIDGYMEMASYVSEDEYVVFISEFNVEKQ